MNNKIIKRKKQIKKIHKLNKKNRKTMNLKKKTIKRKMI